MKKINEDDQIHIISGSQREGNRVRNNFFKHRRLWISSFFVLLLCFVIGFGIYKIMDRRHYGFEYPLSRQQGEVIESLKINKAADSTGIVFSQDEYLGVALKFYKICGLKAEMRDSFPSLDNENVYLVTRSSDYRIDKDRNKIIGDYVVNGQLISKSNWRAGYFVILDGKAEIGIGRRADMRTFILDNKGSMFRQFALVSAGVKCVSQYKLKGKVERSAYVRMENNDLYFVETINPETLYGFSDALIEFGAVDAIYVTGGSQENLFYRDMEGKANGDFVDDKSHQMVVWTRK